jgi:geranylgeranyl pyrophosphate synthase
LNEINHADALLVYIKKYKPADDSPSGTDSTWEAGYAIGHGKPVIMLIEDEAHLNYYAYQWMVSFSINAILTTDPKVAELAKDHPKFVHTTIILAPSGDQFEAKIIEYLDNYYRSIYSRSGIINYQVDEQGREMFSEQNLKDKSFGAAQPDKEIGKYLTVLENRRFDNDTDSLAVCEVERKISAYLQTGLNEEKIDAALAAVTKSWGESREKIIACLKHSILPPFKKIKNRHSGNKKTRPELFFELYDLVTHHLVSEQRFIKDPVFPYQIGAIIELYNWANTYALDDVFDNSANRQNEPTVWKKFSRRDGIFTGLLGHLLALKYLYQVAREKPVLGETLVKIINDYNLTMYQGQVIDLALTFDSDDKKKLLAAKKMPAMIDLYLDRIYRICGGFYEAIGGLAAKAGNKEAQIYNAKQVDEISPLVGRYYGLIQMIRNDLGDYIIVEQECGMSKSMKGISHSDIKEGKVDLAYLIALYSDKLAKNEKTFLTRSLNNKKLSEKDKLLINELLWKCGAIDLTVELLIKLIHYVKTTLLTEYQETPTRMKWMFSLIDITKEILIPFKRQAVKHGWPKYEFDENLLTEIFQKIIDLEKK